MCHQAQLEGSNLRITKWKLKFSEEIVHMKYIEETSHTCNRTRKEQLDQQDKANPGKENTGPE